MRQERLKELIERLFTLKGARISEEELADKIADFTAIASVLNLNDTDEVFGFLAMFEVYTAINRQEVAKTKKKFASMATNAEKILDAITQTREEEIRAATEKLKADLKKTADEKQIALTKSLQKAISEIADHAAQAFKTRTMVQWICGGIVFVTLIICGLYWSMYSHIYNAGYEKGVADTKNAEFILAERDQFWGSEIGKKLENMAKNGTLDKKKLKFIDSDLGKKAYAAFEDKRLEDLLDFPTSGIGSLVMAYIDQSPSGFAEILQCKKEKWEIHKSNGREFCFPISSRKDKSFGYFVMPK